jgi:hypothetical protein
VEKSYHERIAIESRRLLQSQPACLNGNLSLTASNRLGINGKVQYTIVSLEEYVPPHLHVTIGLVNDSIKSLFCFIDNVVEELPDDEIAAFNALENSQFAMHALQEKKDEVVQSWEVEAKESLLIKESSSS